MKIKKLDLSWSGIEHENGYYYFYWWNWLPPELRYWGPECTWYDGPHRSFGLWFINFSWSTPWTKMKDKDMPRV